jgi:hypothetical protein
MVLPPFNSTRSNCSAIWEFCPGWLGWTAITWPTSFDPLGISVPSGVFTDVLVWTTTLSPFFAVFESSFCISSPLTGLIGAVGAAGLADELYGGAGAVLEGLCCAAGLSC